MIGKNSFPALKRNYNLRVSKGRRFYKEFRSGDCGMLEDDAFALLRLCGGKSTAGELAAAFSRAFRRQEDAAFALLEQYAPLLDFQQEPKEAPQLALAGSMLSARSRPWPFGPLREETPFQLELSLTEGCNHRCTYCYQGGEHMVPPGLSPRDWLDVLNQAAAMGVQEIVFTGGEPLLYPGFAELVEAAVAHGMFPRISTNGSLLDRETADLLAQAGAQYVHLSLPAVTRPLYEAITQAPGSLEKAGRAVELLKERGFYIRVKMVLIPDNTQEAEALITFCGERGVDCVHLAPFIPSTRAPAEQAMIPADERLLEVCAAADRLAEKYPHMLIARPAAHLWKWRDEKEIVRCGGVKESLTILNNGNVTFCESLGQLEDFLLGNVKKDSLEEIWNSPGPDRFSAPAVTKEPCANCEYLPACGSGCFLFSYMACGDPFAADPRCFRCPGQWGGASQTEGGAING